MLGHIARMKRQAPVLKDGCCEEAGHIPNRADPDFYPKLRQDLADCSLNIKDFLFTAGMHNGRVMDPQGT